VHFYTVIYGVFEQGSHTKPSHTVTESEFTWCARNVRPLLLHNLSISVSIISCSEMNQSLFRFTTLCMSVSLW